MPTPIHICFLIIILYAPWRWLKQLPPWKCDSLFLLDYPRSSAMSCHICAAAYSHSRLLCPTCARNSLYRPRLDNTQLLLEKEVIGRQVEASLLLDAPLAQPVTTEWNRPQTDDESSRWWAVEAISSQQAALTYRKEDINRHVKALKEEIKVKRIHISERKAVLSRRRSDAESARYQLEEREAVTLTGIQNTSKRTEHLWHSLHSKTAEARIFLCREAAHLYGLRQKTSRRNDARITYVLGGISLVDLRDMNGKSSITAPLCHDILTQIQVPLLRKYPPHSPTLLDFLSSSHITFL